MGISKNIIPDKNLMITSIKCLKYPFNEPIEIPDNQKMIYHCQRDLTFAEKMTLIRKPLGL